MNRYEKVGRKAQGAYSPIWILYDRLSETRVAAKDFTVSADLGIECLCEIGILFSIRHPYIVRGSDYYRLSQDKIRVVMDLADTDLHPGPIRISFQREETFKISFRLLSALNFLHKSGFVHGDVKPANILFFRRDNTVKLADFSLSVPIDSVYHRKVNTAPYRPPEAWVENFGWNWKVDIFAMGVSLFEIIFNRRLFDGGKEDDYISYAAMNLFFMSFYPTFPNSGNFNKEGIRYIPPTREEQSHPLWPMICSMMNPLPIFRPTTEELLLNPIFDPFRSETMISSFSFYELPRGFTPQLYCNHRRGTEKYVYFFHYIFWKYERDPIRRSELAILATDLIYHRIYENENVSMMLKCIEIFELIGYQVLLP